MNEKKIALINRTLDDGYWIEEHPYAWGTEYLVHGNDKEVSAYCTKDGLWDVAIRESIKPLYTGMDTEQAARACAEYLEHSPKRVQKSSVRQLIFNSIGTGRRWGGGQNG